MVTRTTSGSTTRLMSRTITLVDVVALRFAVAGADFAGGGAAAPVVGVGSGGGALDTAVGSASDAESSAVGSASAVRMFDLASSAAAGGGVAGLARAVRLSVSALVVLGAAAEILRSRVCASRASELDGYSLTSHRSMVMALSRSCLAP